MTGKELKRADLRDLGFPENVSTALWIPMVVTIGIVVASLMTNPNSWVPRLDAQKWYDHYASANLPSLQFTTQAWEPRNDIF